MKALAGGPSSRPPDTGLPVTSTKTELLALILGLPRRNRPQYVVSPVNRSTNPDIGIEAFLVARIPMVFGVGGAMQLGLDTNRVGGAFSSL